MNARGALATLLLAFAAALAFAQDLRPVPPLTARVIDQTGTLADAQRAALEAKLAAFEAEAGPQIVVLMVPTTAPEDIAAYAWRVADTWKIGRRDVGDGLLVVIAKNDRRVRIEVARALEGAVPDLAARQIIDRAMVPAFRAGDFAGGIDAALDLLIARIRGEKLPAPQRAAARERGPDWEQIAIFFFAVVPIVSTVLTGILGRGLGTLASGAVVGALGWVITGSVVLAVAAAAVAVVLVAVFGVGAAARRISGRRSPWPPPTPGGPWGGGWGGHGGGFGGGGGFGSGGGGSFGGGGASGGW
ncbi:TPM domain-containing protein [Calidifontimicrobium sp. SYSU G02091]|uniref:TPM domain-containing protein n=1 Tax=Calidifontimicrobium sp. SYSU G02091 TaxID=2926421 RepID=UPI001F53D410|nr:TPM domain-containing protein [Calidifontimicrobium sp. SYSU G02091]MCI1190826.1 TPM domain-containing protein [Calidifontimicrobium sp. SYSU G02091]